MAERRGLARFRTEQPPYSLLNRGVEREVLPVCERYGMGTLVWGPLGMGLPGGRYRKGRTARVPERRMAWVPRHMTDERTLGTVLGDDLLDRIDEIVPPGADIGPLDVSYDPPSVTRAARRRRPAGERAAA